MLSASWSASRKPRKWKRPPCGDRLAQLWSTRQKRPGKAYHAWSVEPSGGLLCRELIKRSPSISFDPPHPSSPRYPLPAPKPGTNAATFVTHVAPSGGSSLGSTTNAGSESSATLACSVERPRECYLDRGGSHDHCLHSRAWSTGVARSYSDLSPHGLQHPDREADEREDEAHWMGCRDPLPRERIPDHERLPGAWRCHAPSPCHPPK